MAAQLDIPDATLVAVLQNPLQEEVYFLCTTSNGAECVWDEVGGDIIGYSPTKGIHYEDQEQMHQPPLTLADFHKACHFTCYRHYIFTASSWSTGMGQISILACIKDHIWFAFPGDGVFVGFQPNDNN